jgi:hypothetical protein
MAESPNSVSKHFGTGDDVGVDARFSLTTKGNGWLELPGLGIRVFKEHKDLTVYKDRLLKCEWCRVDKVLYLTVSGTVLHFDDKGKGPIGNPEPVSGYFRLDAARTEFRPITCSKEIYFELVGPNQSTDRTLASVTPRAKQPARLP